MAFSFNPFPIAGMTKIFITTLVVLVLVYLLRDLFGQTLGEIMLVIALLGLVLIAVRFLNSRFKTITLEEKSITYSSGVLSSRRITLPYGKITEASFNQSLVQRLFGVGTLNVDTAGGTPIAIAVQDIRASDYKLLMAKLDTHGGSGIP